MIKPLERKSLYSKIKKPPRKNWSLNTTKCCPLEKNLPKHQQFKNYYFHNVSEKDKEKYRNTFISTDHISIHCPPSFFNKKKSKILNLKKNFNPMMRSSEPITSSPRKVFLGNRSSVSYNIISNEKEDQNLKIPNDIDKNRITFKSNSISKCLDSERPYSMHFNKEYKQAYMENPSIFKVYNGLFSGMYESAIKNGNIYPPFETKTSRNWHKKVIK